MVYVILGTGFEEVEAIAPVDILRRCGVTVKTAGIGGLQITGAHGITVTADCMVDELDLDVMDMIVLPGGLGGVASINSSEAALAAVSKAWNAGKYVAAICAGPTVLARLGLTADKSVTGYPGTEPQLGDCQYVSDAPVVVDGRLITSRGPGTALLFGWKLAEILCGAEAAAQVATGMLLNEVYACTSIDTE